MANRLTLSVLGCLILFGISACSQPVKEIQVSTKPIDKPELTLPYADQIKTRDVEWIIVTADNYEKVFADLERNGQDVVLFALTDKGYENIALNLSDIRAYIQQQQAIIVAYEGYYKETNDVIDATNRNIIKNSPM